MRFWVANCDTTAMCVGSTVGPNIFVRICGWSTSQISRELKVQILEEFGFSITDIDKFKKNKVII